MTNEEILTKHANTDSSEYSLFDALNEARADECQSLLNVEGLPFFTEGGETKKLIMKYNSGDCSFGYFVEKLNEIAKEKSCMLLAKKEEEIIKLRNLVDERTGEGLELCEKIETKHTKEMEEFAEWILGWHKYLDGWQKEMGGKVYPTFAELLAKFREETGK